MTVLTPPGYLQGGTYTAKLDRVYLATLGNVANLAAAFSARQGFYNGRVPVYANPSAMNVTVGACGAVIANTFASASGDYLMANDATVQVTLAASSPTQNRHDIIGFQVKDNLFDSSGLNTAVPAVIQGANSAGTPSDPALPASFIPVVRAVVNATVTTPTLQSLIRKTTSDGGMLRVGNVTERAEITGHDGLGIYREDRDWFEVHDGTAWRVQGPAICSSTADRDTAITNPHNGLIAVTTDTGSIWQRQAGAWVALLGTAGASASDVQNTAGTTASGAYTATLAGGTACGFAFVAPATGRVLITNNCEVNNSASPALSLCTIRVGAGAVVGAGADVLVAANENALFSGTQMRGSVTKRLTGLTGGTTYNVQQRFAVGGGTGTYSNKELIVTPA